jgi:predicted enzyme related to lactoylglutathione lyase
MATPYLPAITIQIRVGDRERGHDFYSRLFGRPPDHTPSDDWAVWRLVEGCALQVGVGEPAAGSGPLRLCVGDLSAACGWLRSTLGVEPGPVETAEGVSWWTDFDDPWGNRLGFYQPKNLE